MMKAGSGETLDGRFLLLDEIGRGAMATVFKAADLENEGALVAVKVPLPEFASGLGTWSMFQREAELGAELQHPEVLRFISLLPGQRGYIVTEYARGTPLAARVGHGRRLPEQEAVALMLRLCDAVAHVHARGIVHYDLKPENVLECEDGSLRLIDFGLAHRIPKRRSRFVAAAPPMASAHCVAPEQLQRRSGRPSVDIYALGAMFYEMLTGHAVYEGDDPFALTSARRLADPVAPRAIQPAISVQAEEIVLRALRRDPAERYQSVAALKQDLEQPSEIRVSGLAQRLIPVTRWRKCAFWLRSAALIGVLPIGVLLMAFRLLWWYFDRGR
ncbi:MAG TPA: serine/threonine-protein kinase [Polyangiaceae bacterium]|nr:serine/threonine-protein kinase [Polyangiaceae bacterium]